MKKKELCTVESQEMISAGIYSLWIKTPSIAGEALPGQFVSLYCQDGSRLLPRPISLCEIDRQGQRLHMVYRVAGKGTAEFSGLKAGDSIQVMGPMASLLRKQQENVFSLWVEVSESLQCWRQQNL